MTAELAPSAGRRVQLAAAIVAMVCIAPLQYSWTLFTTPLEQQNPWSLPQVQLAFTFFIVAQTLSQPLGGYFMDRRGPRLAFIVAAALIVVGWGGLGVTGSRPLFYALYSLAGVGAGIVYAGAIGTGIRWFPDRRGLALGLIAAGFGVGAAPFTPFVHRLLKGYGVRPAFVVTGLVIGTAVLVVGLLLKTPPAWPAAVTPATGPGAAADPSAHEGLAPLGLLRLGQFWLAFVAFFCMATGLLILTANTRPIGEDFGIAASVIVVALVLQQLLNGASRVVWGWVSDRIGREITMTMAFALTGLFLCLIPAFGSWPPAFVILTAMVYFTGGEMFALFPALTADRFGSRYAAANQGMLYTAKGLASLAGGAFAAWLALTQSWAVVFVLAGALAFSAAGLMVAIRHQARPVLEAPTRA
jgi:OFA family oxalate/formate antiporter-like MFS transporter